MIGVSKARWGLGVGRNGAFYWLHIGPAIVWYHHGRPIREGLVREAE